MFVMKLNRKSRNETHSDGLHNNMRIWMVQSSEDDLQAFFSVGRARSYLITNVHNHSPFLRCVLVAGRFL